MARCSINLERCYIPGCKPRVHAGFRSLETRVVHRQFVSFCLLYQTHNKCYFKEEKIVLFCINKIFRKIAYIL